MLKSRLPPGQTPKPCCCSMVQSVTTDGRLHMTAPARGDRLLTDARNDQAPCMAWDPSLDPVTASRLGVEPSPANRPRLLLDKSGRWSHGRLAVSPSGLRLGHGSACNLLRFHCGPSYCCSCSCVWGLGSRWWRPFFSPTRRMPNRLRRRRPLSGPPSAYTGEPGCSHSVASDVLPGPFGAVWP